MKVGRETKYLGQQEEEFLKHKKPQTARAYRNSLRLFIDWYDGGVEDLFDRLDKNLQVPSRDRTHLAEGIMVDYIKHMKSLGKSNNTIRNNFAAIQNFLKYKGYLMSGKWIGNYPGKTAKKENSKQRWTLKQVKEFVEKAPSYRDKAIILTMFQSGQAINETINLDYGDVEAQLKSGQLPIQINMVREKSDTEYRTFLGADAAKYLKLYLGTRTDLETDSPLFARVGSEQRITRMGINTRFREIAKKLSFVTLTEGANNPARPHSMRSDFRSRLTGAKMDHTLVEYWMGHRLNGNDAAYVNLPDEDLREAYMAVESRLSIETTSKDVMEGRPTEGEQTYLLREYQSRLAELEAKNDALSRMMGVLAERLGMDEAYFEAMGIDADVISGVIRQYNPEES